MMGALYGRSAEQERLRAILRRGAFVAYCAGYGCGTALHFGDDYVHSALGSYCRRCWQEIQRELVAEEHGHVLQESASV